MVLSGPDALRALEEALRDIHREETEAAHRVSRSAELIARTREQEAALLLALCQSRPEADPGGSLAKAVEAAEANMHAMLAPHAAGLTDVEAALAAVDSEIADLTARRVERQLDAKRHDETLRELAARIRPRLAGRADYTLAVEAAEAAQQIAAESLRKTLQAEADRDLKGKPYRDDRLFMYLWERGYGTKGYRTNPVVIWLDDMVARLVGYAEARPNFAMLNEIPLRLREHAERQADRATAAAEAVAALANAEIDADGGGAEREQLLAAVEAIDAIDVQIVALEDERDALARQRHELALGEDEAFAAAARSLTRVLRGTAADAVAEAAADTASSIDGQLIEARQRVDDEEFDAQELRTRLRTLALRRRQLEDIVYELKQHGFDNPRAQFADAALTGDALSSFLRGSISAADYWEQWRRQQQWSGVSGDATGGDLGGPGGGWGLLGGPPKGTGFSRPRRPQAPLRQAAQA
jgi:hypothetical protein